MKNVSVKHRVGGCAVPPLQHCCFMSQHLLSVKTWFRAPNVMLTEVTHLVSRITKGQCAKMTLSDLLLLKDTCVWSFLGANAPCNTDQGPCTASPASSRLIAISGISETRTTSLYLNDENLSVCSWELFHLAFPNSCLQLFHNNSNN